MNNAVNKSVNRIDGLKGLSFLQRVKNVAGKLLNNDADRQVIYQAGRFDLLALRRSRVARWEVLEAARERGLDGLDGVRTVVLRGNRLVFLLA